MSHAIATSHSPSTDFWNSEQALSLIQSQITLEWAIALGMEVKWNPRSEEARLLQFLELVSGRGQ